MYSLGVAACHLYMCAICSKLFHSVVSLKEWRRPPLAYLESHNPPLTWLATSSSQFGTCQDRIAHLGFSKKTGPTATTLCVLLRTQVSNCLSPLMYNICLTHCWFICMCMIVTNSVAFISICSIILFLDPLLFQFLDTFGLMQKIQYYECDILKNIPMFWFGPCQVSTSISFCWLV